MNDTAEKQELRTIITPIIVMVLMILIGLTVYLTANGHTDSVPSFPDAPVSYFKMDGNTLYFDPECYHGGSTLVIPKQINGAEVLALGNNCFAHSGLETVYLPNNLKRIEDHAFFQCPNLRCVFIPDSTEFIGDYAFSGCSSLEAIRIGQSVNHLGSNLFDHCTHLHFIFYNGSGWKWNHLFYGKLNEDAVVICPETDSDNPLLP